MIKSLLITALLLGGCTTSYVVIDGEARVSPSDTSYVGLDVETDIAGVETIRVMVDSDKDQVYEFPSGTDADGLGVDVGSSSSTRIEVTLLDENNCVLAVRTILVDTSNSTEATVTIVYWNRMLEMQVCFDDNGDRIQFD